MALVEADAVTKRFPIHRGFLRREVGAVHAVDGVNIAIERGETLALVGESGCGKSTMGRLLVRLLEPTSGAMRFDGNDITRLQGERLRTLRARFQMIFQDPYGSLDPRMDVTDIVTEPLRIAGVRRRERRERAAALLRDVGLPAEHADRYPHQFSGGQRQRIGIARALVQDPDFVVADEPVSALDVSVQAQVVNLLQDLQERRGLTYLFVSHDLAVVRHIADRVAVMYVGEIVERAGRDDLFGAPLHPYTQALLAAAPVARRRADAAARTVLKGELPSAVNPPPGCRFHTRCPLAFERCRVERPRLLPLAGAPQRAVACHAVNP